MLGDVLGTRAGLELTLLRFREMPAFLTPFMFCGEVWREVAALLEFEGFNDGVREGVLLPARMVGVISSLFSCGLLFDAPATSTERLRYSEVSMDTGGISSLRAFVVGRRISDAGVTGALRGPDAAATSSCDGCGFNARGGGGGGGAIKTSGSGSGDTESFDDASRLIACGAGAEWTEPLNLLSSGVGGVRGCTCETALAILAAFID